MKFKKKSPVTNKLSRKQQRKEKRIQKKVRKNEYYTKRGQPTAAPGQFVRSPALKGIENKKSFNEKLKQPEPVGQNNKQSPSLEQHRNKEKKVQDKLQKEMNNQRNKQLLLANEMEDRSIKKLEKQLKLTKKKSKGIAKCFIEDGLDYLLEACDPDKIKSAVTAEQQFVNFNDDFVEDLALMSTTNPSKKSKNVKLNDNLFRQDIDTFEGDQEVDGMSYKNADDSEDLLSINEEFYGDVENSESDRLSMSVDYLETDNDGNQNDVSEDWVSFSEEYLASDNDGNSNYDVSECSVSLSEEYLESDNDGNSNDYVSEGLVSLSEEDSDNKNVSKKRFLSGKQRSESNDSDHEEQVNCSRGKKLKLNGKQLPDILKNKKLNENRRNVASNSKKKGKVKKTEEISTYLKNTNNMEDDQDESDISEVDSNDLSLDKEAVDHFNIKGATKVNADGTWEDIYGRVRDKDGSLLSKSAEKYVPPAGRSNVEQKITGDEKTIQKFNRLKRQLKGLINRLAESNMHNIATQIEGLYMNNSRNDMNETLTNLILESAVSNVLTPERLLIEQVLLIAVLHANVGTEVGAHFLQVIVTKFVATMKTEPSIEDKTLDNIVIVVAQLYNFKLCDNKLMYEIIHKLADNFTEKNIDCILHILKNVGFNLRKDDPLALKDLILELQKKAATISEKVVRGTRVKFLLDILLAIKNNNMSKIPNYDNTYSEHMKKIMKGFIRKGNYVTQLNISYDDLLKAEEKGKWWVVGSAWTGNTIENQEKSKKQEMQGFSQKLLELARKQRMNTDTRRNIFCIIMSAEDYLDAFEKLLHLGLTNNQDREIIHVILHCCLQENPYNPYYAFLAQKFCDYDRKYQLTIKYSIWDKLKALGEQSANQLSNLAKLLTHLFLQKGLSISTLKIVQFSELDKLTLRFMRQILLGILLHEDMEACTQVFEKIAQSEKLKMFRESLRLFIHHFLLRNINSENVDEKQRSLLDKRSKIVEKLLVIKERSKF